MSWRLERFPACWNRVMPRPGPPLSGWAGATGQAREVRLATAEEHDSAGDLRGLAEAADRDLRDDILGQHRLGEIDGPGKNDRRGVSEWRKIWANGLPTEGRFPKSGHRMTAEGMPLRWRWNGGTFSRNWGLSGECRLNRHRELGSACNVVNLFYSS